ncbi:unnamed protein product [Schistocephalus solidus]|uniref:Thioredoxin-related transmembrane protein 2-B n=1 Tax=Schistocephalus solidus TaxID=70667 RepID=A0A0X3PBU8_SCHSO|nr:unnamed protein product [Schistocephalus solidus]
MHSTGRGGFKQLLHPYYIINILLSVTFPCCKTLPGLCEILFNNCILDFQEYEVIIFLASFITIRNKRQFSITDYVAHFCMYAKLCNLFMFWRQSLAYACLYGVLWVLQSSFLFQPVYKGPESVLYFRPQTFDEVVRHGDPRITWIIAFYTAWSPACNALAPIFSELSHNYALPFLKFGKVDVTRSPDLARVCNVDNSTWSKQLPTIIMFRGGKEIDRRPGMSLKTKTPMKFSFCWDSIISAFSLNDLYSQCKGLSSGKKTEESAQSQKKTE